MGWKKGSVILEARPYAHVICQQFKEERCNFCLKSSENLKKCGACKSIWYCSAVCQKGDWQIHKTECPVIKRVPHLPTDSMRLYLRLVIRYLAGAGTARNANNESPCVRTFCDLKSHAGDIKTDKTRSELFQIAADFLRAYTHGLLVLPQDDVLLDIFGKMVINTFTIADEMLQDVGVAVYTSPSILDHRCWPNAVASFDGRKVTIRAVAEIDSDSLSEVYLSYVDPLATRAERQKQLQEQYYFTCDCTQCCNPDLEAKMTSEEGSNKGDLHEVQTCFETVEQMKKDKADPSETLSICEACLDHVTLPPLNVHLTRLRGVTFDLAIEAEMWEKAMAVSIKNLKSYTALNPPYTPSVGYLYANMGKLLMFLGRLREAVLHFNKARENFTISLGQGHYLYGQVRLMLEQCEAELSQTEAD